MLMTRTIRLRAPDKLAARIRNRELRIRRDRSSIGRRLMVQWQCMLPWTSRFRGSYGRLSLFRVSVVEITRSTWCTQSARGTTRVHAGEVHVYALHEARWGTMQLSS